MRRLVTISNTSGKRDGETTLPVDKLRNPSATVLVSRCNNCEVFLPTRPVAAATAPSPPPADSSATVMNPGALAAKLVIESCADCKVNADIKIFSGTADLISLTNCTINFEHVVPTLQIDGCKNTNVILSDGWFVDPKAAIFTDANSGVTVRMRNFSYAIPDSEGQHITKFIDGRLQTIPVVREGCCYPTTQKEKDFEDEKLERLTALLEQRLKEDMKISKPKGNAAQNETPPPPEPPKKPISPRTASTTTAEPIAPPAGLFGAISSFDASKLKPTTTRVTHESVVFKETTTPVKPTGHGHTDEESIREYFDKPGVLEEKMAKLVQLVQASGHLVIYTGAGISTSAKIPDYRGPRGVWTMADKGEKVHMEITIEQALPTLAHKAIAKLVEIGKCKYVVSTNVDGLHRRSGVPKGKIAELHGNCYLEKCLQCKKEYMRNFDCFNNKPEGGSRHQTSRMCDDCGCPLQDSIVHFGESLPEIELLNATEQSNSCDLALVLGTSMMVAPACLLPLRARRMVIGNLQKTRYDSRAEIVLHARTDELMSKLMQGLGIPFTR